MISLGLDLAANPANTAAVLIDWSGPTVEVVASGVGDEDVVELVGRAEVAGFDVPLGWPSDFVDAIASHHRGDTWPAPHSSSVRGRDTLRYRRTDRALRLDGHAPLSASTDLIGVVALRAARVQQHLRDAGFEVDRSGVSGVVVEVYPAASLRGWGWSGRGYKGPANREARERLVGEVLAAAGPLEAAAAGPLRGCSDHVLDAFVCAVVAAASRLGLTPPPGPDDIDLARREGWIHLPTAPLHQIVAAAGGR